MNGHRISAYQEPKPEETILLRWEDGDYAGLVVRCRREVSLGLMYELGVESTTTEAAVARFCRFADEVLIEWNLNGRDGEPLTPDAEGISAIPASLALAIVKRYAEELTNGPLGQASPTRLASTLPLENGSASRRTRSANGR